MATRVRGTLFTLGAGALLQRLAQLLSMLCIARTLGTAATGVYALGMAAGTLLAVLAGAGIRNFVARQIVREPATAGDWVRSAVRARLLLGLALLAPFALATTIASARPLFWCLCGLQVVPLALDLKGLLDALARTRREVLIETTASLLQFAATAAWMVAGGGDLATLAAIALGARGLYAAAAVATLRRLPRHGQGPSLRTLARRCAALSLGQTANELATTTDVLLVGWFGGDGTAGLYAVAQRIAGAASQPSALLARLLLPHFHRAATAGDPARMTRTALRACAFAVLPLCAGGMVTAEPLCALFGNGFAAAAWPLRLCLIAVALQHLGWQCSHALFGLLRERAYVLTLGLPALLHGLGIAALVPLAGATGAAASAVVAQAAYWVMTWVALRRHLRLRLRRTLQQPLQVAAITAAVTATVAWACEPAGLPGQLVAGGLAFLIGLWRCELRGRSHRFGAGLVEASGFHGG